MSERKICTCREDGISAGMYDNGDYMKCWSCGGEVALIPTINVDFTGLNCCGLGGEFEERPSKITHPGSFPELFRITQWGDRK